MASESSNNNGVNSPAPFLSKTYDMVDDISTDSVVSWSSNNKSFVVWNVPEFSKELLPKFFKHKNFASFVRQLNTYVSYFFSVSCYYFCDLSLWFSLYLIVIELCERLD